MKTLRLEVDGCGIEVVTDERKLRDQLTQYFRTWIARDSAGPADIRIVALERPTLALEVAWVPCPLDRGRAWNDEESVDLPDGRLVLKRRTGMVFAFGGDLHLVVGRCLRNRQQIMDFVNDRYVQWRLSRGHQVVRAGAVAQGGRCLALCGPAGSGKSAIALRLVTGGLDFVSKDQLLIKPSQYGVEVMGTPKHPRVSPGTILSIPALEGTIGPTDRIRLRALPAEELAVLEHQYDVLISDLAGAGRFATRGHLAALGVLNWDASRGEPTATEVDLSVRRDLLPHVLRSAGLFHEPWSPNAESIHGRALDVLSRRPVVEFTGRQDVDAATRLAREVLDQYT